MAAAVRKLLKPWSKAKDVPPRLETDRCLFPYPEPCLNQAILNPAALQFARRWHGTHHIHYRRAGHGALPRLQGGHRSTPHRQRQQLPAAPYLVRPPPRANRVLAVPRSRRAGSSPATTHRHRRRPGSGQAEEAAGPPAPRPSSTPIPGTRPAIIGAPTASATPGVSGSAAPTTTGRGSNTTPTRGATPSFNPSSPRSQPNNAAFSGSRRRIIPTIRRKPWRLWNGNTPAGTRTTNTGADSKNAVASPHLRRRLRPADLAALTSPPRRRALPARWSRRRARRRCRSGRIRS